MPGIRIDAPAKLNLNLIVGNRRPDGFHEIESLFLALAFGDTLYLEAMEQPSDQEQLEIHMDWQLGSLQNSEFWNELIPPEKNIISRAVSLFRRRTGCEKRFKIVVEKRIPPGGGLGGGSSNAAATLLALNRLAHFSMLDETTLADIGAELGSDVPFFLNQRFSAAWVSGRGECIQPFELPQAVYNLSFVLVNPGFSSDTAQAYRLLDRCRETVPYRQYSGEVQRLSFSGSPAEWQLTNDFLFVFNACSSESVALEEAYAAYREMLSALRSLGADFAGLSGSGSSCFGVFSDPKKAGYARETLLKRWPCVIETFPLAR